MIKLINNKEFINILNLICSIKEEVNISFMKDKIYLRAVHSSNSNALVVEIKNTFFKEYNIENEMTYTISLENMIKLLNYVKKKLK
jgi:DNA polymerase III sliding clamp (beta) subunit (PCNA family)